MKLTYKLILGYLLVASIAGSATYFAFHSYGNINSAFDRLMSDPVPTLRTLNELKFAGNRIVTLANEVELVYVEANNSALDDAAESNKNTILFEAERQFIESGRQYDDLVNRYRRLIEFQSESEKRYFENIEQAGNDLIENGSRIVELKKKGVSDGEILRVKVDFGERQKKFFQLIDDARVFEYRQLESERTNVKETIIESTRTTLSTTLLTLCLAIAVGLYISRSIANRIIRLKIASERVGGGALHTNIEIRGRDEIGALTKSFNKMVGDLRESRAGLIASENFVSNIVSSIADSVIVLDMDLKIVRLNRAALDLTCYEQIELTDRPIGVLCAGEEFLGERNRADLHTKGSISGIDTIWLTKDSRPVSVLCSASVMYDAKGKASGIVCVAKDITVRKSLENQLSYQALHDSLTGLANRVLFQNRVEHALTRVGRSKEPIAVMFLDLDNFKNINDTLGHSAGDILLREVAERLNGCLRQTDTIARLGGDEFAVLLESAAHAEEIYSIAERLNAVLRESFSLCGKEIFVHTSIGIAVSGNDGETIEDLLRNADVAMYKAKNQGKDCYVVFENRMHEDLLERVEFEAELRRAIEQEQFVLHYQPIVNLRSKEIVGIEALVRWNHPQKGLIMPAKFIPIAEETNLIVPLGQWILEESCRQACLWQNEFPAGKNLALNVNLSNKQVQEGNLVEQVAWAMGAAGLAAENLILEITENTMLHDTESTINKLNDLKNLGIRLAIDDFGTGYSSLSYLQRFPIDILKIDKSFVDKIDQDREGTAVLRAIITMSETLHLKVVAEGIETVEQDNLLQKMGCEFGQGHFYAKPFAPESMDDFLRGVRSGDDDTATDSLSILSPTLRA